VIRALLEQAQLLYLWQFVIQDEFGVLDSNLRFLVQSITIPGIEIDHEAYSVGGLENYYLTQERRGGVITANFVEIEGDYVDRFMRNWLDQVSPLSGEVSAQGANVETRYRAPKGVGSDLTGYVRDASVYVYGRDETQLAQYKMLQLIPKKVGEYEFSYENSGIKMVPVQMLCNEVRRV
jgi:hypothetical protein